MQKQAPSLGRHPRHGGLRALVLRPAALPVARLRRPDPAAAEGLPLQRRLQGGRQLAQEADVRISGVSVGKVKVIDADQADRRLATRRSSSTPRYAPIPKDTKAILRQKTLLGETYVELTPGSKSAGHDPRERRACRPARCRRPSSSTRSSAPSTRRRARRSSIWMQQLALASQGRGRDINDALGNLAPFAEDTTKLLRILNAQHDATCRAWCATPARCSTRSASATASCAR